MQGLEEKSLKRNYLALVATNRPWDLDSALRDRFNMGMIFTPHPDGPTRRHQIELLLRKNPKSLDPSVLDEKNMCVLEGKTNGLSARVISEACANASRIPLGEAKKLEKESGRGTGLTYPLLSLANLEQAISEAHESRNELPEWYEEALDELNRMTAQQRARFGGLMHAGEGYLREWDSRGKSS